MECDTKLSPCRSYELKWNHLLQAANTSTGMQGCNFHQGWRGGALPPLLFPPPSLAFAILFPVFNTETEIGFNSLIIRLVLVSRHPMIGVDEPTQLCSMLCPTLQAKLFSSFLSGHLLVSSVFLLLRLLSWQEFAAAVWLTLKSLAWSETLSSTYLANAASMDMYQCWTFWRSKSFMGQTKVFNIERVNWIVNWAYFSTSLHKISIHLKVT